MRTAYLIGRVHPLERQGLQVERLEGHAYDLGVVVVGQHAVHGGEARVGLLDDRLSLAVLAEVGKDGRRAGRARAIANDELDRISVPSNDSYKY